MTQVNIICTSCKKGLNIPADASKAFCVYCGAENIVNESANQVNSSAQKYLEETDPMKRQALIVDELNSNPNDEAWLTRLDMWNFRYKIDKKKNTPCGDQFLQLWQMFIFYSQNSKSYFNKVQARKDIIKFFNSAEKVAKPELYSQLVYEEMYNSTRLYINCCLNDSHYSSTVMNMVKMSAESLSNKIEREIYTCGVLLFQNLNLDAEYGFVCRAVEQAYSDLIKPVKWVE